jgi:hypothetical protein
MDDYFYDWGYNSFGCNDTGNGMYTSNIIGDGHGDGYEYGTWDGGGNRYFPRNIYDLEDSIRLINNG